MIKAKYPGWHRFKYSNEDLVCWRLIIDPFTNSLDQIEHLMISGGGSKR
jgi:hypothetical protein